MSSTARGYATYKRAAWSMVHITTQTRCITTVSHSHRVRHPPPVVTATWAAPDAGQHYGYQPLQAECLRSQGNGSGGGRIQEWDEIESLATAIHGLGPASTRCTQR
ncbi:hypothetical protein BV22DRAFT_1039192 [Leucogyrophana mollusca]|uniref:Uncharacterized protein n=1 Tax=Leucogyrophana mollusca TaxID=85980 RepID=A0ACB8B6D1_9AGAM|nr:hypothetical protein BV22DRAFT_1039192 [Leucogyrophana mollusca]